MYLKYLKSLSTRTHFHFVLVFLVLGLFLLQPTISWTAGFPASMAMKDKAKKTDPGSQIPAGLSPDEVDAYLAGLSDEQARQVLARQLKQKAVGARTSEISRDANREEDPADQLFHKLTLGASIVFDQMASFFSSEAESSLSWQKIISRLSGGLGVGHIFLTLLIGLGIIICGLVSERLVVRLTSNLQEQILNSVTLGRLQRLGRFLTRILLELLGIGAYVLATFVLVIFFFRQEEAGYWVVSELLIVSYYFMAIVFAARIIMAPKKPALRLLPLQDRDATFLYNWIFRISLVAAIFITPGIIFLSAAGSLELFNLFFILSGLSISVLMIVMIWQSRQRVAEAICSEADGGTCEADTLRIKLARTWHFFAILYVAGSGTFWLINVFMGRRGDIINLIASLFLIPIFIGLDQWVQRLLKIASGELPEVIDFSSEEETETDEGSQEVKKPNIKHFAPLIRKVFRFVLAALLFFIILGLWGIDLSFGRIFAADALKIIMIVIIGFVIWEFAKSRIDRKLKEEMPDSDEEMEEGGAGGSRIGTLLMLLRKFILAIMIVMVSLIVLSSLGVNIGPLIAGAGVVGLAIGFGAQTLVKDIISGIFFLVDDAFRVGDFIETAGTKGMVEHISLRSLRLRHPRGPVHTIPFGGMGTVTNNSRDYIISKLDFRVRYDTNVDKVRKIIKKINKKIMKDEEMGPVMLGKIKSQGVREMDDSAMIMRVKFKTIPGEQFVVRREVFRMMQESFAENGIEFAHRNVTVYLPPENLGSGQETAEKNSEDQDDPKIAHAAAAAAAAIQAEEEAKEKLVPKKE
ncbi:MAG: mechanosensitive ion channel family protein [Desulfobacterales bacterium]|jgi:small-conductance mechanosensitive channel